MLKAHGYERPRIKLLPTLRIGAEAQRQRGYHTDERVTAEMMEGFDPSKLLCQHSRIVTDRGVPVARLIGVDSASLLERLTADGVIGRSPRPRRPKATTGARVRARRPVSDLVGEQRR